MPRSARRQPVIEPVPAGSTAASLSRFTSTNLVMDIGAVTREVMKRGAAIITRHDAPVMVVMSMDRYAEMEKASSPDLDALTSRFDAAYARMQAPGVAHKTLVALDLGAGPTKRNPAASASGSSGRSRATAARTAKASARRRA